MIIESFKSFAMPFLEADTDMGDGGYEDYDTETGAEEEETADLPDEEGEEEQEAADPAESKTEADTAFANMRRELEELKRANEQLQADLNEREEALGLFFDGDNKVAQAHAHYNEVPVEEVIKNMELAKQEAEAQSIIKQQQEQIDRLTYNNLKAEDLRAIKQAHPEANIKDVEELGEKFFQYRTMGIPAVEVYEAFEMKKGNPPKGFGKAQTGKSSSDFYTRDEVASMSQEEVHKNYEKIRKSMARWK